MRIDQPRPLTAAQQFLNLRKNPICAGSGTLRAGRLVWRFRAAPTPLSREYALYIDYRQGDSPHVVVEAPDLTVLAEGRCLPHVYEQKPCRLCLYLPRAREWGAWMRIDLTIVPWALLWLFYFEEWLSSNEWKGDGKHPGNAERQPRRGHGRRSLMATGRVLSSAPATQIDGD